MGSLEHDIDEDVVHGLTIARYSKLIEYVIVFQTDAVTCAPTSDVGHHRLFWVDLASGLVKEAFKAIAAI